MSKIPSQIPEDLVDGNEPFFDIVEHGYLLFEAAGGLTVS
jgi:hypothetical protein